MTPAARREAVAILEDAYEMSERRACRAIGADRTSVRQAIEDARRDGVFIVPLCPFAKAQIDRHPEWQDVISRK